MCAQQTTVAALAKADRGNSRGRPTVVFAQVALEHVDQRIGVCQPLLLGQLDHARIAAPQLLGDWCSSTSGQTTARVSGPVWYGQRPHVVCGPLPHVRIGEDGRLVLLESPRAEAVPLPVGSKLGPYEVLSFIRGGGQGEVYRARDPRLNREVAIKVLPEDRQLDDGRRRRFVQEAHAASALNHPHIVTIHEIESDGARDFIVMELVRGRSLDELIPRQGMRLGDVLRVAIAVADALAAAHARGIVHRDLKPANVMVGAEGTVKVLDFGLAKLRGGDANPEGETVTHAADAALSVRGVIAGTAAYMSPEQAIGEQLDARSDIFSFGAMLYEMVTGQRAFPARSTTEILAAVVRAQPVPPAEIVSGIPRDLEKVILRCLRKDPDRRFQTMLDVKIELQEIQEDSETGSVGARASAGNHHRTLVASLVVLAAIAAAVWLAVPKPEVQIAPRVVSLTSLNGWEFDPAFSPDAEQIAFAWDGEKGDNTDIYLKMVGASDVRRVTTDPARDHAPAWSPDGRQIAFVRDRPDGPRIHLISPLGGSERRLSDFPADQVSWSPDNEWIVASRAVPDEAPASGIGLSLIQVQNGQIRSVTGAVRPGDWLRSPAISPDGRSLAYASCSGSTAYTACDVYALPFGSGYVASAPPIRVATARAPVQRVSWSRDGATILYDTQPLPFLFYLFRAWPNATRPPERVELAGLGARSPATARAQDRLAFVRQTSRNSVYRVRRDDPPEPVLSSSWWDFDAQFSPDGRRLAFSSTRSGEAVEIWIANADGSGAEQLTHGPGRWQGSPSWSPDGGRLVFDSQGSDGHWHIWTIDADGGQPRQLTTDIGDQNVPFISRDGRWIYFTADEGKGRDVWRMPAGGGPMSRVTRTGSWFVIREAQDGRVLYQPKPGDAPLLSLDVERGTVRQIAPCAHSTAFAVSRAGIHYTRCSSGGEIHLIDATGADKVVEPGEHTFSGPECARCDRLAVSPDGSTILVQQRTGGADLVMIENFR